MHDAACRVRGFASDREPALEVAVEWHAVLQKIVDTRTGFAGESERDVFVDDAAAHCNRICGMSFGAVAFGNGRRDTALCPCAGRAFAERRGGNYGDGAGREFQRAEQARESAADDDDVGRLREIVRRGCCHVCPTYRHYAPSPLGGEGWGEGAR